jgi:hypothetical protein
MCSFRKYKIMLMSRNVTVALYKSEGKQKNKGERYHILLYDRSAKVSHVHSLSKQKIAGIGLNIMYQSLRTRADANESLVSKGVALLSRPHF